MKNEYVKPVIDSTTEIIIVLDRSGSMRSIAKSTVEGFNDFLLEHRNAKGNALITLVQFDDRYELLFKSAPIENVPNLVLGENFILRGTTALFDAIGRTINTVETNNDVVFVIITDGMENASVEYNQPEDIRSLITEKEEKSNWKFIFLAANQDAMKTGGSIGIKSERSMTYAATSAGASRAFKSMSVNTAQYRGAKSSGAGSSSISSLSFSDEQRNEQD